jgi:hypothetical protein
MTEAVLTRGLGAPTITENLRAIGARVRLGHDGTTGGWIVLLPVDSMVAEIAADETPAPAVFVAG